MQTPQSLMPQLRVLISRAVLGTAFFCFGATTSSTAEYHVTPQGAGEQDGSDWANALPKNALDALLSDRLEPGDRVLLGSGTYAGRPRQGNAMMVLRRSGTQQRPVTVEGVDTGQGLPLILGRWMETNPTYHAHSYAGLVLAEGVSHVRIAKLRISHCMHGVTSQGANRDVEIVNVAFDHGREGFTLVGLNDSFITDCRITQYTKRGIRFREACENLRIKNVTADCSGGDEAWPTENFPIGFSIMDDPGNQDIRYEHCTARNHVRAFEPDEYWNGDGFCAENSAQGISYYYCLSVNNNDGGWDDKSLAPLLVDCVAIRNKRAFRFWNARGDESHPARMHNCLAVNGIKRGGSGNTSGIWASGAVVAERCTLHNTGSCAVDLDNNERKTSLVARDCIFSSDRATGYAGLIQQEEGTRYRAEGVILWIKESPMTDAPQFAAPSPDWDGAPVDAYNNTRYRAEKGCHLTR